MTKRLVNPTALYDGSPIGLSHGTIDEESGLLFISGQVAWDLEGLVSDDTVAGQFGRALGNLKMVLAEAGASVDDLLQMRIYIRGELEDHMEAIVPILFGFLGTARTAITGIGVSSLASRRTLVEVEAVARLRRSVAHKQKRNGGAVPLIDHVILTISDLEKARACYGWLLPQLGYGVRHDIGPFTGWFSGGRERGGQVWIKQASAEGANARFDKDSPGLCELAFSVEDRETLNRIAEGLSSHGFTVTDEPAEYDYVPGYYAVYFLDPDGIKLEIVARQRE